MFFFYPSLSCSEISLSARGYIKGFFFGREYKLKQHPYVGMGAFQIFGKMIIRVPQKWISKRGGVGPRHRPLILLRLRTRIIVHAQTAAQQQSNGNF